MTRPLGSMRAGAVSVVAKLGSAMLGIAANVILTRLMGPEEFGRYALGIALGTVVAVVASCGMPFGAIRFLPTYLEHGDFAALRGFCRVSYGVTIVGGAVCAGAMMLGAQIMEPGETLARVLPWAALIVVPAALAQGIAAILQARGRVAGPEILQGLVRQGTVLALIGIWVAIGATLDFGAALGFGALAAAATALVLWIALARATKDEPRPAPLVRQGVRAWIGAGSGLLAILVMAALNERVDLLVLGWIATPEQLGIYSAAARVASIAILALAGLGAAYMPRIAGAWAAGDRARVERLCREGALVGAALTGAMTLGAWLLGEPVLSIFGPEFRAGATVLTLLLAAQIAVGTMGLASGLAVITGNARIALTGAAVGLSVNAAVCVALVPRMGMTGAAIGTLAALAMSQLLVALLCSRRLGLRATLLPVPTRRRDIGMCGHA